MTLQNAVKNAKIEGKPRIINPTANLLEITVAYDALNGSRTPKKADLQVRLRRFYDPVREIYLPETDPDARKDINEGAYFNPVVSIVPFTKVNGDSTGLIDFVMQYFNNKFIDQYK
ncbi:hypothetical protein J4448_01320 [Candidatus Woesearchaeota archaeon]|nr:hypothetical protein [Candidatus Woesearchaeota archaeon]